MIIKKLKKLIIYKNVFEHNLTSYRLQSWKYIYRFSDGSCEFATVNKVSANGVSGYGISGIVIELNKIKWLKRTTSFGKEFIQQKKQSNKRRVLAEKEKYKFLKSLPKGLSRKEYDEILIEKIIK